MWLSATSHGIAVNNIGKSICHPLHHKDNIHLKIKKEQLMLHTHKHQLLFLSFSELFGTIYFLATNLRPVRDRFRGKSLRLYNS